MITILTNTSIIKLFDLNGYQIIDDYYPGHEVLKMAMSPRVDDTIIATLGSD